MNGSLELQTVSRSIKIDESTRRGKKELLNQITDQQGLFQQKLVRHNDVSEQRKRIIYNKTGRT